jgi:cellulose synthase/poly-beta-1,6-N-acetylglucosamine synthase-like glycosyltransferase
MILLVEILVIISVFFLLHSYLLYPIHLYLLSKFRNNQSNEKLIGTSELPVVSIIISVYNEENIISQKLKSVLESDYPGHLIKIFVGSDDSSDKSNEYIKQLAETDSRINFYHYTQRRGKALVINDLVEEAFKKRMQSENHILLFTDANVILVKQTLRNLCRHFSDSKLALVDSKIIPTNLKKMGISYSEKQYMSLEIRIKHMEGELWGSMMGAFGGCFALRSTFFEKVPSRFLVDDFYISMCALNKGGLCKSDLDAICYEGTTDHLQEEFKRKARISAGNFQNLNVFYKLLFRKPVVVAYAFFSHKVLRWLGPLFILIVCAGLTGLTFYNPEKYSISLLLATLFVVIIPVIDYLLSTFGIHIKAIRGIRYFIAMNIALLIGFIKYVKGIQKSSWEPPKRSL